MKEDQEGRLSLGAWGVTFVDDLSGLVVDLFSFLLGLKKTKSKKTVKAFLL